MKWAAAIRALILVTASIAISSTAHLAGGGRLSLLPPLLIGVFSLPLMVAGSRTTFTVRRSLTMMGLLQVALHFGLSVSHGGSSAAPMSPGHHLPTSGSIAPPVGMHDMPLMPSTRMLLSHVAATLLLSYLLRRFEADVRRLLDGVFPRLPGAVNVPLWARVDQWPGVLVPADAMVGRCAPARAPPFAI